MKKIVITGALGHIGSSLIWPLAWNPEYATYKIVLIDDLSTQRYCSLFGLKRGRCRFVEADIRKADLVPILEDAEACIHLAARTNAEDSFKHPDEFVEVNVWGTRMVADACLVAGVPLIFASTTSVYGPPSPYSDSKIEAEILIKLTTNLRLATNLRYKIFRFGTIVGPSPGMRFHTAVNKFCWQYSVGQPITVWTPAIDQVRPYCALEDASKTILNTLKLSDYDNSTTDIVTAHHTVREILNFIDPNIKPIFVDSPAMNQVSYRAGKELRSGTVSTIPDAIYATLGLLQGLTRE